MSKEYGPADKSRLSDALRDNLKRRKAALKRKKKAETREADRPSATTDH